MNFHGLERESLDLPPGCVTITFVRWLMALVVSFAVANPAGAGVFKARGSKPATAAPAKKDKPAAKTSEPAAAPAKKAPAKAAAAPAKKAPVKKAAVASSGRPDDLTPEAAPPAKKGKKAAKDDVAITVEDEDDVIIRDIDD